MSNVDLNSMGSDAHCSAEAGPNSDASLTKHSDSPSENSTSPDSTSVAATGNDGCDSEGGGTRLDDAEVRSLLRSLLRVSSSSPVSVLPGVQRKIRQRSHGKFYADGWSTGGSPPSTYIVTSVVMLVVMVVAYFVLSPGGWIVP